MPPRPLRFSLGAVFLLTACAFPPIQQRASNQGLGAGWVDSVLMSLSPRDRAAQLVWPQVLADYSPDQSAGWNRVVSLITAEHVGGFVMSVGSPTETAVKLNAMQRLSDVPLIIGSDYEAGAGFRSRGGFFLPNAIYLGGATIFPPQMALGATGDTTLAYEQGRVTAREGRAMGVHMAFAPILDVNNNPNNPIIGPRSFGEDPRAVAAMGSALIRGLQNNGMYATGKHFPGHGDTETNSHLAITTVTASRARLDSVELVPFRQAVRSDVAAIMTFHGVVPALDSNPLPATLSPIVMRNVLRGELRFDGLLITDALDMNGVLARIRPSDSATTITGSYGAISTVGLAEVVKRAVEAGIDVLLMPLDVAAAIDAVVAGVREGRFTQARVDSSARRILMLKYSLGLHRTAVVNVDSVRHVVGIAAHGAVADSIARRSITVPKDSLGLVPLAVGVEGRSRVLSITIAPRSDLGAGVSFDAELRRTVDVRSIWVDPGDSSAARIAALADSAHYVTVSSYLGQGTRVADPNAPNLLVDLIRALSGRNPRTIVIAFGNPYLFQQISFVSTYVVAWGGFAPSQNAAARALLGTTSVSGRLPISIPPSLNRGAGVSRPQRGGAAR